MRLLASALQPERKTRRKKQHNRKRGLPLNAGRLGRDRRRLSPSIGIPQLDTTNQTCTFRLRNVLKFVLFTARVSTMSTKDSSSKDSGKREQLTGADILLRETPIHSLNALCTYEEPGLVEARPHPSRQVLLRACFCTHRMM